MVVPPILLMLATHPLVAKHDLSSLQMFMSAAAPLGQGLTNQVLDRLKKQGGAAAKNLKITQAYGLTETSGASVSLRLEFVESKAGSVGRPWATFQYKVIGEEGEDLKAGETGELCMRGPGIMQGYWRNPKATEETFIPGPERWFKTGDSVRIDEDGFILCVSSSWSPCTEFKPDFELKPSLSPCAWLHDHQYRRPDQRTHQIQGIPSRSRRPRSPPPNPSQSRRRLRHRYLFRGTRDGITSSVCRSKQGRGGAGSRGRFAGDCGLGGYSGEGVTLRGLVYECELT